MKSMPILIAAFTAVLIGIMLLGSVATETYGKTGRGISVVDEQLDISSSINRVDAGINGSIAQTLTNKGVKCSNGEGNWISGSVVITNLSGTVLTTGNYTVNYVNNSIYFINTSTLEVTDDTQTGFLNASNITLVDYRYQPSDYLCQGWSRTILNMVPGFFGLAILAVGVGLFYLVAKQEGVIGDL